MLAVDYQAQFTEGLRKLVQAHLPGSRSVNGQTTRQCVAKWSSATTCRAIDGGWV